jgi:hypothetical protein
MSSPLQVVVFILLCKSHKKRIISTPNRRLDHLNDAIFLAQSFGIFHVPIQKTLLFTLDILVYNEKNGLTTCKPKLHNNIIGQARSSSAGL